MKTQLGLALLLMLISSATVQARFVDPTTGASQNTGWSWTAVKQKVTTTMTSWFHRGENQGATTRTVASDPASMTAPVPTVPSTGFAPNGPVSVSGPVANTDTWNPFKRFFAVSQPEVTAAAPGKTISPDVSLKWVEPKINEIKVSRTAQAAVPFQDKNLALGRNGVPVFEFKKLKNKTQLAKVKKVPLLNVGTEEILDSKAFEMVSILPFPAVPYEPTAPLASPEVASIPAFRDMVGAAVIPATPAEKIEIPILEAAQKVTADKIAKLIYTLTADNPINPLPVTVIAEEDLKILRGLILFEKKDQCHVASGIFADLVTSTREDITASAEYHLGSCLHEMNLTNESIYHLGKVIRSTNTSFTRDAIKVVLEDLQLRHESEVVEMLNGVDPKLIPSDSEGQINYLRAKYNLRKGHPEKALELAVKVPSSNAFYYKAQYLASVAEYELGKEDASISRQKTVAADLARKGSDKDTLALFEMNTGRVAFQKGKYKDSIEAYQKVPRENSLWMQGLMELGWSQLQSKDLAGAIGNMHSIQSPYFDGVYKPESYVVRTIGYVNLCQFGDAYKSLAYLDGKYTPWLAQMQDYLKSHSGDQVYQTVLKMLQTKGAQSVDGVPVQTLREVARQRDFLNAQEAINQLIDENSGYAFIKGLIEKDKKSLLIRRNATINKVAEMNNKIKKARSTPDAMKNFNAWRFELANLEDFLAVYEFKVKTMKEGEDGLARLTPHAQERIASKKGVYREVAGRDLKTHLARVAKELNQQLENNELLKYEVFAGSGENLRYKMAGGKVGGAPKVADRKPSGMKWDFDGEYWADEIGNYRSSLKNNCQNVQLAGQRKGN